MISDELFDNLRRAYERGALSRRQFLRTASVLGLSAAASTYLVACGGDDDDSADDEATEPEGGETQATATGDGEDEAQVTATGDGESEESPTEAGDSESETGEPTSEDAEAETPEQTGPTGGTVTVHWPAPPDTLNPLFTASGLEQALEVLMFGALVKLNAQLEPIPDLAESIEVSDDVTIYTFKLYENIMFNDGEQLTSEDVRFTLERAIDNRTASYWQGRLLGIDGAEAYSTQDADSVSGIETPDDLTIQITLTAPDSVFLIKLADFSGLGILPQHVLGEVPPDQLREHDFSFNPTVGAGPFNFVQYQTDQFLELERNPDYFMDPPRIDRFFMRILETNVAVAQLETGEIDLMRVEVLDLERVRELPNVSVQSVPSAGLNGVVPNLEREFLQDSRVRQAMTYAVDRESIIATVFQGEAEIINEPILFGPEWMGEPPDTLLQYEYDPDMARQLLEEAGWDTDQPILVPLTTSEPTEQAVIIQQQWAEVGLKLEFQQMDNAEFIRRVTETGDFDIFFVGGGVFRIDPSVSEKYFMTENWIPGGGNYGHYSNSAVDDLFLQGRETTDLEARKEAYTEIAHILNEEAAWAFLWSPNLHWVVNNRLKGFEPPNYYEMHVWDATRWTVESE